MSLLQLPAELLLGISSFLAPVDLARLGLVCRRTSALLEDQGLWSRCIHTTLTCKMCLDARVGLEAALVPTSRSYSFLLHKTQQLLDAASGEALPEKVIKLLLGGWCQPIRRLLRCPVSLETRPFEHGSGVMLASPPWSLSGTSVAFKQRLLLVTCRLSHWDFVMELLQREPCLAKFANEQGETALHFACKEGKLHVVKYLLELGGDPTIQERAYGWTPLSRAIIADQLAVVQLLLGEDQVQEERLVDFMTLACEHGSSSFFGYFAGMMSIEQQDLAVERACSTGSLPGIEFLSSFVDRFRAWRPFRIHQLFRSVVDCSLLRTIVESISEEARCLLLSNDFRFNGFCVLTERQRFDLLCTFLQYSDIGDEELLQLPFMTFTPHSLSLLQAGRRMACEREVAQVFSDEMKRRGCENTLQHQQLEQILDCGETHSEAVLRARLRAALALYQDATGSHTSSDTDSETGDESDLFEEEEEEPWE